MTLSSPLLRVVILLLLLAGGLFVQRQFSRSAGPVEPQRVDCDLQVQDCAVTLADGRLLQLKLDRRPLAPLTPVHLQALVSEETVTALVATIRGLNMDMGVNRVRLAPGADGGYSAQLILPVCSNARMHWALDLQSEGEGDAWPAPLRFEFVTERR